MHFFATCLFHLLIYLCMEIYAQIQLHFFTAHFWISFYQRKIFSTLLTDKSSKTNSNCKPICSPQLQEHTQACMVNWRDHTELHFPKQLRSFFFSCCRVAQQARGQRKENLICRNSASCLWVGWCTCALLCVGMCLLPSVLKTFTQTDSSNQAVY